MVEGVGGKNKIELNKKKCSGVGLRPSSTDERIDSSMFVFEVFFAQIAVILRTRPYPLG